MRPEKLAEIRAFKDFREVFPGVKFDKFNRQHSSFMERQVRAHLALMERNRLHKKFGNQWETPKPGQ